jgi:hypothetical protein
MVDRNPTVAGNYAEKFGLLSPLSAADAGANRRGHRNRLTRRQLLNSSYRVCRPKREQRRVMEPDLEVTAARVNQPGAVSGRMSIRQPVSRAASRAFWPSRPMASDS